MTKHDFAIHLFTQARTINAGKATRVPVVAMLVLLVLAKRPGQWIKGTDLCANFPTISPSTVVSSTGAAVQSGFLDRRPYVGGVNNALEWTITNAGLHLVHQLLATDSVPA